MKDVNGDKIYEGDTVSMRWGAWMKNGKLVPDIRMHVITFWQKNNQMAWHLGEGCFNIWNGKEVKLIHEN